MERGLDLPHAFPTPPSLWPPPILQDSSIWSPIHPSNLSLDDNRLGTFQEAPTRLHKTSISRRPIIYLKIIVALFTQVYIHKKRLRKDNCFMKKKLEYVMNHSICLFLNKKWFDT